MLRLLFEIREFTERRRGLGAGLDTCANVAGRGHVVIVVGVDQIQDQLFPIAGKDGPLFINPTIHFFARFRKLCPIVGVMINAVAQNEVVQFPDALLQMIGNLKTLQLDGRQFFAQLPRPVPGAKRCPGNKADHAGYGQHKSD